LIVIAGIRRINELIDNNRILGNVIDIEVLGNKDYPTELEYLTSKKEKKITIKFDIDNYIDSYIDYGSDIQFSDDLKKGDRIKVVKYDAYAGSFERVKNEKESEDNNEK
jgi:hypothetical protein